MSKDAVTSGYNSPDDDSYAINGEIVKWFSVCDLIQCNLLQS